MSVFTDPVTYAKIVPGAHKAVKEHVAYTVCQVPSQSNIKADWFPCKETTISLFETIYMRHQPI